MSNFDSCSLQIIYISINIYINDNNELTWSYFVDIFHMVHTTKELFKGMSQIDIFIYVFILQNTNMCISSIIYEITNFFWLMQRFEVVAHMHFIYVGMSL